MNCPNNSPKEPAYSPAKSWGVMVALAVIITLALVVVFTRFSNITMWQIRQEKTQRFLDRFKETKKPRKFTDSKVSPTPAAKPPADTGELACVTGVAVPREDAVAGNTDTIRTGIRQIKNTLGISVIWQLFPQNSSEADWKAYFDIAREEGAQVLAALTDANYTPSCSAGSCQLGIVETFLQSVANNPGTYSGVLYGVLLIDEPYEDINAQQLRSLYAQAKAISSSTPVVVGWSREIMKFGSKPGYEFTDGMADIHLISALEVRNGTVDEAALKRNQETSRSIIRAADPDARIASSVPVFGASSGNYQMPTASQLQTVLGILLSPSYQKLDGLMWQSWEGPNRNKAKNQDTLSDPGHEDLHAIVRSTCTEP